MHRSLAVFGKHSQTSERTDPDYAEKYQICRPAPLTEEQIQKRKAKLLKTLATEKDKKTRKAIAAELWNLDNQNP